MRGSTPAPNPIGSRVPAIMFFARAHTARRTPTLPFRELIWTVGPQLLKHRGLTELTLGPISPSWNLRSPLAWPCEVHAATSIDFDPAPDPLVVWVHVSLLIYWYPVTHRACEVSRMKLISASLVAEGRGPRNRDDKDHLRR